MVLASDDIVEDGLSIASGGANASAPSFFLVEPAPMPRIPSEFPHPLCPKCLLRVCAKRHTIAASERSVRKPSQTKKLTFIPASSSSRHEGSTSHRLLFLDWRLQRRQG